MQRMRLEFTEAYTVDCRSTGVNGTSGRTIMAVDTQLRSSLGEATNKWKLMKMQQSEKASLAFTKHNKDLSITYTPFNTTLFPRTSL
jgi:hypothetical protein